MNHRESEVCDINQKMYTDLSWCPSAPASGRISEDDNYKYNGQPPIVQMSLQQISGDSGNKYTSESELELHSGSHSSGYNNACGGGYYPPNNNEDSYTNDGGNEYYVQRYSPCYSVYENSQENPEGPVLLSHRTDEMCENGNNATCMTLGRPPVKRRNTANKKERRRTQSINNAFAELRDCIPNVPNDTKLSKIKTLRLARSYIAYLSDVLSGDDMCSTPAAFTAEISRKSGRGDERRKKELLMAEIKSSSAIESGGPVVVKSHRKTKGRTGWPQHVWAQELQQ